MVYSRLTGINMLILDAETFLGNESPPATIQQAAAPVIVSGGAVGSAFWGTLTQSSKWVKYIITVDMLNITGFGEIRLFVNGDENLNNYNRHEHSVQGGANLRKLHQANNAVILKNDSTLQHTNAEIHIMRSDTGVFHANSIASGAENIGIDIIQYKHAMWKDVGTIASITALKLLNSNGNQIANGSKFYLKEELSD